MLVLVLVLVLVLDHSALRAPVSTTCPEHLHPIMLRQPSILASGPASPASCESSSTKSLAARPKGRGWNRTGSHAVVLLPGSRVAEAELPGYPRAVQPNGRDLSRLR
jgi:hypothetical protein